MLLKFFSSGDLAYAVARRHLIEGILHCFSTCAAAAAAAAGDGRPLNSNFMADYLVASCGLSPDRAITASKGLSHITSLEKPDAVLGFFRAHGFSEPQIRKLISHHPKWLVYSVEKTLAPKILALQGLGFSGSTLTRIIAKHPALINLGTRTILPRIEFWRGLLGSDENLTRVLEWSCWFLCANVEKKVMPNLSLLREHGVSDERTAMLARYAPILLVRDPKIFRELVERVTSFGVPGHLPMFIFALVIMNNVSRARFQDKQEMMRRLGWSDAEFLSAFRKNPIFLTVSEEMLKEKMDFLVKEAGCEPSHISCNVDLLMYSLNKRMIPRYRVMKLLNARGLLRRQCKLRTIMSCSEKNFIRDFIDRYIEEVPDLNEMYMAGCSGKCDLALNLK